MKKMNSVTKLTLLVIAGVMISALAFADGPQEGTTTAKSESAVAATPATPAYPIDFCIVSGEKLGGMGDPVVKTYNGREVRFCCPMCPPKFEKDQKTYMKKLDDAIVAAQKPSYPLETCVVSGEPLAHSDMGDPVDYVYNNRLVRLCCNHCVAALQKNPNRFLAKIDAAFAKKEKTESPAEGQEQAH